MMLMGKEGDALTWRSLTKCSPDFGTALDYSTVFRILNGKRELYSLRA